MLHLVADFSELEKEFKKRVLVEGQAIMLTLLADKVYAIQDKCTHLGASLSKGIQTENHVQCRLHGAKFNIKSGDVIDKAHIGFVKMPTKKLKTYKTEIKDGKIYLDL